MRRQLTLALDLLVLATSPTGLLSLEQRSNWKSDSSFHESAACST